MSLVTYRKASIKDLAEIAKVHVDSWQKSFASIINQSHLDNLSYKKREEAFKTGFGKGKDYNLIVAEINGQIVGFVDYGKPRSHEDEYESELYAIYILKDFQRKGIGKGLVNNCARDLIKKGINSMFTLALEVSPYKKFHEKLSDCVFKDKIIDFAQEKHQLIGFGWKDLKAYLEKNKLSIKKTPFLWG